MSFESVIWPLCLDAFKVLLIYLSFFVGKDLGPIVYDPAKPLPTNWQKIFPYVKAIITCTIISLFFNKGKISVGAIEFFALMVIPCALGINKANDNNHKKILKWSKK
jgi:hypothetical protein